MVPGEGTEVVNLTPAPASPPAAPPPPANTPAPSPVASPAAPSPNGAGAGAGGGATTTQTPVQPQQAYTLPPEYLAQLTSAQQEAARYRQQATQLEPLAAQWQRYQQDQQKAAQAEQQKKTQNPFGIEYDDNLRNWVRVNEQGQYEALPGAPAGAVDQFIRQERSVRDALINFARNPGQYMQQLVGQQASQIAEQMVQQHMARYDGANYTTSFIRENSSWMMEGGQVQFDMMGQPQGKLSQEGLLFAQNMANITRLGVTDQRAASQLAKEQTYAALVIQRARQGQLPGGQQAAAAPATRPLDQQASFLATAHGVTPATPVVPASPPPAPPAADLSLDEALRQAFKANGITDQDIRVHGGN